MKMYFYFYRGGKVLKSLKIWVNMDGNPAGLLKRGWPSCGVFKAAVMKTHYSKAISLVEAMFLLENIC